MFIVSQCIKVKFLSLFSQEKNVLIILYIDNQEKNIDPVIIKIGDAFYDYI